MSITSPNPQSPIPNPGESQDIVLAFSGGLDTSFCVPWLQERGWTVHTVFADTGGVDAEERDSIEARAAELGVQRYLIKPYQENELLAEINSVRAEAAA